MRCLLLNSRDRLRLRVHVRSVGHGLGRHIPSEDERVVSSSNGRREPVACPVLRRCQIGRLHQDLERPILGRVGLGSIYEATVLIREIRAISNFRPVEHVRHQILVRAIHRETPESRSMQQRLARVREQKGLAGSEIQRVEAKTFVPGIQRLVNRLLLVACDGNICPRGIVGPEVALE